MRETSFTAAALAARFHLTTRRIRSTNGFG
jgi:hypothetical protein